MCAYEAGSLVDSIITRLRMPGHARCIDSLNVHRSWVTIS